MSRALALALALAMSFVAACASSTATKATATPPIMADGSFAPRLFTVAELRDGMPRGRVIELRMQIEGKPTTVDHWEVTAADAEGATIHSVTRDAAGQITADETGTSKWTELHDHAKFLAASTRIADGSRFPRGRSRRVSTRCRSTQRRSVASGSRASCQDRRFSSRRRRTAAWCSARRCCARVNALAGC